MSVDINYLNKALADFCGKRVMALSDGWVLYPPDAVCNWNPCEDHNQMVEVKEKLRERGYGYSQWFKPQIYHASIFIPGSKGDPMGIGIDPKSELLALALAVEKVIEGER